MRWFISDTHFGHKNVIEYSNRPFNSVNEMDEALISNWNKYISKDDTVFHLGDFAMCSTDKAANICNRLNGIKFLILGNHDGSTEKMKNLGFAAAFYGATIKIEGQMVDLIHIPPRHPASRLTLHGHVHQHLPFQIHHNRLNLSVEVTNYLPVSEKQIASLIRASKKGQIETADLSHIPPASLPDILVGKDRLEPAL